MADNTEHTRSILKNDPDFQGLDFAALRAEGIGYVASLSGKVWTDHNVHDPGITILELLCYALIDLGYRTRMPAIDLFTRNPADGTGTDDNFFTPAQILTCNPVTILDFRKLLIDIKGVKNAWLDVNEEWIDCAPVATHPNVDFVLTHPKDPECKTFLNGLYKVNVELYKGPYTPEAQWSRAERAAIEEIVERIRAVLMAHRNLCEDFVSVRVLCKEKIGVCADIDLDPDADAEKIYVKIIETLRAFFSPDPRFYTLPQLLDKGLTIDEAFAGRPFLAESHGFIDTAELEALPFRKEIHVSDVYNALFAIPGIRTVRRLRLRKCGAPDTQPSNCEEEWKYFIAENHTPEFSLDCSGFRFTRGERPVTVNEKKYKDLFALNYSFAGKILRTDQVPALDLPVPQGVYRSDLADFYSIQNELPRVYGVSEGGIPDTATPERKAQALQLKGYLLFFDQLLANYLAQLGQLRKLFALKNGNGDAHTYFSALPRQVPDMDRLLRFVSDGSDGGGTALGAVPVQRSMIEDLAAQDQLKNADVSAFTPLAFDTAADRDALVYAMADDLQNGAYTIRYVQTTCERWFFYIYTSSDDIALAGRKEYADAKSAQLAALNLVYIGGFVQNYKRYTTANNSESFFQIELALEGYAGYLQQMVEDRSLYAERRNAFLDHLLARFAESFTDFALLSFDSLQEEELKRQDLAQKSSFLTAYDHLGRDRGKAYDYRVNGWSNKNISGFEQRVRAYAGIGEGCGASLCHFEVFEYTGQYYWSFPAVGGELFKSTSYFDSPAEAATDLQAFLHALKDEQSYRTVPVPLHDRHALAIEYKGDQVLYPVYEKEEGAASSIGAHLRQLLDAKPQPGDIEVSSQVYRAQLVNEAGAVVRTSSQAFDNANKALSATKALIKKINEEEWTAATEGPQPRLELKAARGEPFRLVDIAHFTKHITVCPDEYRWQLNNDEGSAILHSAHTYPQRQAALESLLNELTSYEVVESSLTTRRADEGYAFDLMGSDGSVLASSPVFGSEDERRQAMDFAASFCKRERADEQYTYLIREACHWQVDFGEGLVFRSLALLADDDNAMNTWRKEKRAFRRKENYVWDWNEAGNQQLSVKSEGGEPIARLVQGEERENLAEEIFNRIQESLNDRSFTATPVRVEEGFGFRLRDGAGQELLSGYLVYPSRGAAFFTYLRALDRAAHESMYLRSGDEGNRAFTFLLKNDEQQFLAEHRLFYDTEGEREDVLQKTIRSLNEKKTPADGPKEPVRHTYSISTGERPLLYSAQKFPGMREAGETVNAVLILAGDPANYSIHEDEPGNYSLRLISNGQWIASAPGSVAEPVMAEGLRNELLQTVGAHLYRLRVAAFDDQWRFRLSLGLGGGRLSFLSDEEYPSIEATGDAYAKMAADIANLRIQREGESVKLVPRQKNARGRWATLTTEGIGEGAPEAALSTAQALFQLASTTDGKALERLVRKDELAEQGTWVYRLVKKDDPFAYHLPCDKNESRDANGIKTLHAAAAARVDYLLICLGGDIIDTRISTGGDTLYHYTIKARNLNYPGTARDLVLFISVQGYASPEEAERAFNADYLTVLKRASQVKNYGPAKTVALAETLVGSGSCAGAGGSMVYVPQETMALFADEATAIARLSALARSYPVRLMANGRYKFSLYDYKLERSYFISAADYATPTEAMQAFYFLLVLVKNRRNYYIWCNDDTGHQYIVLREVLLESSRRYPTNAAAWEGIEELIGISQTDGSFHISVNRDDCCFSFFVACKSKIVHPCTYDTPLARDRALRRLYEEGASYEPPALPDVRLSADARSYEVWLDGELLAQLPRNNDQGEGGPCAAAFLDFLPWIRTLGRCVGAKSANGFVLLDDEKHTIAFLDKPSFSEDEWLKKLVQLASNFPIYKKDGLYYFRIPFNQQSKLLDDSVGDPCGCDEQLPPEGSDCYAAWTGGCYATCAEAFAALKSLPELLKDETRYRPVFDCSCGAYRIELIDPANIAAFNPQCYTSREMVCAATDRARALINCEGLHLVEHILLRPRCNDHCGCLVPSAPDPDCHFTWKEGETDPCLPANADPCFTPGSDPYSCIATVVLPAWSRRFRSAANRELVERILYREAPAHILLRILWLSPKDCCRFEGQFRGWMRWLAGKETRCGKAFDLCAFIDLLFRDALDCWWPTDYCLPCTPEATPANACAELTDRGGRTDHCDVTVNDVYDWTTPDCCYEYPRVNLPGLLEGEKMKTIRRRSMRYTETLTNLHERLPEDGAIGQALSYVKGARPDEEKLLRIAAALKEGGEALKPMYDEALRTVVSFYLDRSLLDQYDSKKLSDIRRTVRRLNPGKGGSDALLTAWNGSEVTAFVHSKTMSALQDIFKK